LSVKTKLPVFVPEAVGVKVSATVQVPDAATELEVEQVVPELAMANGPVVVTPVKVRLALPVLVTVTVCAGLVLPIGSDGKVGAAEKLTTALVPVPLRFRL
jgi:outer membrane usher protein FimD/PapC